MVKGVKDMVRLKSNSQAFQKLVNEVDDILSKVHSTDYRGNPTQMDDSTFIDAKYRLENITISVSDVEHNPINEFLANELIFDELQSRIDKSDEDEARHGNH